jgi:transcriptional regulator with XRE-family HTH domain
MNRQDPSPVEIGLRIRSLRGKVSREEFARSLQIHPQTLVRYEKGERTPDAIVIARICSETRVSLSWLLFGEGLDTPKGGTPERTMPENILPDREPYGDAKDEEEIAELMRQGVRSGKVSGGDYLIWTELRTIRRLLAAHVERWSPDARGGQTIYLPTVQGQYVRHREEGSREDGK